MGFSILPRNRLCSIIISWFRLGFRGLSSYPVGILFHHHFLVPARVPGLVSLLASYSIIICWFRLGFRGLSSYFFGILFHHPFLVPARVPGLVSLFFWHPVPSSFPGCGYGFRGLSAYSSGTLFHHPGSGHGSSASLPTLVASCSIIISWLRLGSRGLSPYSSGALFHHPFLIPARVPGLLPKQLWRWVGFSTLPRNSFVPPCFFGSKYSGILFHHHFLSSFAFG